MATQDLIEHIAQLRVGFEAAIETVRESASRVSHDAGNNLTMMEGDIAKALIDDVASENFKRIQKSPLFAVTLPIPTGHSKEAIVAEISRKIASTCSTLPEYLLIQLYRSFEVLCNQWLAPSSTSGQQIDFPKHPKPRLVTKSREGIALDALSEENHGQNKENHPIVDTGSKLDYNTIHLPLRHDTKRLIIEERAIDSHRQVGNAYRMHDQGTLPPKITIRIADQVIVNFLLDMEVREISRLIRIAIEEDSRIPSRPVGSPWVAAINQLETGDLELVADNEEDCSFLLQDLSWAEDFMARVDSQIRTYSVQMSEIRPFSMDLDDPDSKAKVIETLMGLNGTTLSALSRPDDIRNIYIRPRVQIRKTEVVVVDFLSPELANKAIDVGMVWEGSVHDCILYPRPELMLVEQCAKCQVYGHPESDCFSSYKCGICAGSHATIDCGAEFVKCAGCGCRQFASHLGCPRKDEVRSLLRLRLRHPVDPGLAPAGCPDPAPPVTNCSTVIETKEPDSRGHKLFQILNPQTFSVQQKGNTNHVFPDHRASTNHKRPSKMSHAAHAQPAISQPQPAQLHHSYAQATAQIPTRPSNERNPQNYANAEIATCLPNTKNQRDFSKTQVPTGPSNKRNFQYQSEACTQWIWPKTVRRMSQSQSAASDAYHMPADQGIAREDNISDPHGPMIPTGPRNMPNPNKESIPSAPRKNPKKTRRAKRPPAAELNKNPTQIDANIGE